MDLQVTLPMKIFLTSLTASSGSPNFLILPVEFTGMSSVKASYPRLILPRIILPIWLPFLALGKMMHLSSFFAYTSPSIGMQLPHDFAAFLM